MRISILLLASLLITFCSEKENIQQKQNKAVFRIEIILDPAAYKYTNFGEPPQIAVWIENQTLNGFYPVWVTHRSGTNDWMGKVECPVALPFWDSRKLYFNNKKVDIVTGATPKNGFLSIPFEKKVTGTWNYFVEVNASADYNSTFRYWSKDKTPDSEGNGQPSLVYKGDIDFNLKTFTPVNLIGRTAQNEVLDSTISNLEGITTAQNLIKKITVIF